MAEKESRNGSLVTPENNSENDFRSDFKEIGFEDVMHGSS
jgi:hypothetical protein